MSDNLNKKLNELMKGFMNESIQASINAVRDEMSGGSFNAFEFKQSLLSVDKNSVFKLLYYFLCFGTNFDGIRIRADKVKSMGKETPSRDLKKIKEDFYSRNMTIKSSAENVLNSQTVTFGRLINCLPALSIYVLTMLPPRRSWAGKKITNDIFSIPILFMFLTEKCFPNIESIGGKNKMQFQNFVFYNDWEASVIERRSSNKPNAGKTSENWDIHKSNNIKFIKLALKDMSVDEEIKNSLKSRLNNIEFNITGSSVVLGENLREIFNSFVSNMADCAHDDIDLS